jgi:hypothetical protein
MRRITMRQKVENRIQVAKRKGNIALALTGGLCLLIVVIGLLVGTVRRPLSRPFPGSGDSPAMQSSSPKTGGGALEDPVSPPTGTASEESPSGFSPGGSDGEGGLAG